MLNRETRKFYSVIKNEIIVILPFIVLLFGVSNFAFNIGYLGIPFGLKFMSLLVIQDYYEGSAPLITAGLGIYWLFFGTTLTLPVIYIKEMKEAIPMLFKMCKVYCIHFPKIYYRLIMIKLHLKHSTFVDKKNYLNDCKELTYWQNLFRDLFKKLFIVSLFYIVILGSAFFPIYVFYLMVSHTSMFLFIFIVLLWLVFMFSFHALPNNRILFVIIAFLILSICLGFYTFINDYNNRFKTEVISNNNEKLYLVRPLSRGALTTDTSSNIIFVVWDDILAIKQQR